MAETKNQEEITLHAKRKPDLLCEDDELNRKKIQKLQILSSETSPVAEENGENEEDCEKENKKLNNSTETKIFQAEIDLASESEDDDGDEEDEVDYEDDEDAEKSDGVAVADRKGKGISREDKGKGKLIEEEEDDDSDSDDDDDDLSQSEGESDLSDDPLAEVDLDNILPSRTRRRTVNPGFYIANDLRNGQDDHGGDSNV